MDDQIVTQKDCQRTLSVIVINIIQIRLCIVKIKYKSKSQNNQLYGGQSVMKLWPIIMLKQFSSM